MSKSLCHPGPVQKEVISSLCCRVVSQRRQFISNHRVSKFGGCAKVKIQFGSSQRWMKFPVPHVTVMCLQLRERDMAFEDSQTRLLHHPPADWATLCLPKAICCDGSEASSLLPHLLSLLSCLCQLRTNWLYSSILILSWPSGFLVYLACDEPFSPLNPSLNFAQPVPPIPT